MSYPSQLPGISFQQFLFHYGRNRLALIIAAIAIVLQFAIFKYFYPFASYIHGDSFSYLNAAYQNLDISTYMIGYSRFLRLFSVFFTSDLALTAFQYLLVQTSALFFLSTLFYFYQPGKKMQVVLFVFMLFNPLFLHLANLISSDCLFLSLSLTWLSLLLWIIHRPSTGIVIGLALVLFLAFTLRYNALIYPLITLIAFLLAPMPLRRKITGFAAGVILCILFAGYTTIKYHEVTGRWQYAPFSGWQWANNSMYVYRYIDSADRKPVPERFRELDQMIRTYFDNTRDVKKNPQEALIASTAYMWSPGLPLFRYRNKLFNRTDSNANEFKRWASMGPLYGDYGRYIIRQYPWQFLRHFVWPNSHKYYAPPVEFLAQYNSGKKGVTEVAKNWFGYKDKQLLRRTQTPDVHILDFYPILTGTMNVVFLACLVCFIWLKGFKQPGAFRKGVLLISLIWLINAGFTILASSAALRFQSFPVLLIITFALLLVDWLIRSASKDIDAAPAAPEVPENK